MAKCLSRNFNQGSSGVTSQTTCTLTKETSMYRSTRLATGVAAFALALSGCVGIPRESSQTLTAAELVRSANEAWGVHCSAINALGFSVAKAQIALQAKTTDQVAGNLGLLVLKASASRSVSTGQTLSIGLVPRQNVSAAGRDELSKALDKAFNAIIQVARFAKDQSDADLLQVRVVRAAVGFDLIEAASGGVGVTLGDLSIGGSAGRTTSGAHSMEFELHEVEAGKAVDPSECAPVSSPAKADSE
jgi:hypothetical protein